MKRKRIMIIGPGKCGKTSLANALEGEARPLGRTHDTIYRRRTLEIPSAYLENTWMYTHLIALAQDAWCILVLVDQSQSGEIYSPGFASAFRVPLVGVITKSDLSVQRRPLAEAELAKIGVRPPYFAVDAKTNSGIDELETYLKTLEGGKGNDEVHHRK